MTKNVFSVPIFFIAAIIVSVLLGLAEQIVHEDHGTVSQTTTQTVVTDDEKSASDTLTLPVPVDDALAKKRLIRKLRIQIFSGAALGLFLALAIGAAFIAVWFTKAADLWSKSEELWEGIFEIIACLMIFIMGMTMLKMDRAKTKWRIKLSKAFDGKQVDGKAKTGKWVLFILPFITVLREGLEAVVFVGGVALGQSATSIPIAAIVGLVCGLVCGFLIYEFASRTTLSIFMIVMTNFVFLIGAGLFSRAVSAFERRAFDLLLGQDIDDAGGDGPGSYRVQGNVWHLDCCNPENNFDGQGWTIFNAIFGWTNSATLGTVLSYVFYWIAVIVCLIGMKYKEVCISYFPSSCRSLISLQGRTKLFGRESAAGVRRRRVREIKELEESERANATPNKETSSNEVVEVLPR
ncbi:iron permease FTR1 [Gymnopilus junonius]|uniref:Iron permease FTR1 n=1 Tax=Gymnopilus junonius TaxID=109634 RepID=A0A9P5NDL4_GYMJU|nr:iron permease FTR1 [Gymnopilus junonius]